METACACDINKTVWRSHIAVLLLKLQEEVVEVGSAKMGDGAEAGEETAAGDLLEVSLADVLKQKRHQSAHW